MAVKKKAHLASGIVAGAIGGLVASWMMNLFMESPGAKFQQIAERIDGQQHSQPPSAERMTLPRKTQR